MTSTFTWIPKSQPSGTATFRVLKAQFGDGYTQTAADGINNKSQSWPLSFIDHSAVIAPIRDFLDAQAGAKSFYWTPPLGTQGMYRCTSYNLAQVEGDIYQITATFEQSFQP